MSCKLISKELFAKTMPVRPPIVNKNKKPKTHSRGVSSKDGVPCKVASHEKILMPVGTAMIIVAEVKYARVSTSIPTVNIWWAHTTKPNKAIDLIA